jgi:hypothetical protein
VRPNPISPQRVERPELPPVVVRGRQDHIIGKMHNAVPDIFADWISGVGPRSLDSANTSSGNKARTDRKSLTDVRLATPEDMTTSHYLEKPEQLTGQ